MRVLRVLPAVSIADAQGLRSFLCCSVLPRQAYHAITVRPSPLHDAAGECSSEKEHRPWKGKQGHAAGLAAGTALRRLEIPAHI